MIPLIAATMVLFSSFIGLVADAGLLWTVKRRMQSAADAAAIAAASALRTSQSYSGAANDVTSLNGFAHGTNNITVTANYPPTSGPGSGNLNYVEVIVSQPNPTFFMRIFGHDSVNISARAVANSRSHGSSACVFVLDPSASSSLHVDGGGSLTASCGVVVNSSSSTAVTVGGGGSINAPEFGVGGSYTGSVNSPIMGVGIAPVSDPLAYLPPPEVAGCGTVNYSITSGTAILNPGVYCGDSGHAAIQIGGTSQVTLNPGMYVVNGGGVQISGTSSLAGNGVTIYNTGAVSTYKPIIAQDSSVMDLRAPTSGVYEGILLFNDRTVSMGAGGGPNILGGSSGSRLEGVLYFPSVGLELTNGQAPTADYTIVVARQLGVSGNAFTVNGNYSSLANGSPIKVSALYE